MPPDLDLDSIEAVLDAALAEAQRRGYEACGWTIQRDDEAGYAAWLHQEDTVSGAQEAIPGMRSVACYLTIREAANSCLDTALALAYLTSQLEA